MKVRLKGSVACGFSRPDGIKYPAIKKYTRMKNMVVFLAAMLFCSAASAQWKAQTAETYENTYRMAFVTSTSGTETLRIMRAVTPGQKAANPYDQITGQILLSKNIGTENRVLSLVLRFDDSPKMYIHQPADMKQDWDANVRKFIIESDWQMWRLGDTRNKQARSTADNTIADRKKEIIDLLKASQKVNCQIVLLHKVHGTQSIITTEFVLKNSTKSMNFLLQ